MADGRYSVLVLKLAAAAFFVPEVRKRAAAVLSSSSHSSRTKLPPYRHPHHCSVKQVQQHLDFLGDKSGRFAARVSS